MDRLVDDADMDGQLRRSLAAAHHRCADVGEVLALATRLVPGDLDSWHDEWSALAERCEAEGRARLLAGHHGSARTSLLKACEYWRQAFYFCRTDLDDPRLARAWHAHRSCFQAALPLLEGTPTLVDLPLLGTTARGYLVLPPGEGPHRVVLAPCGYDSTAEAGWAATGAAALEHGWGFCVVEGPGQGGMLYDHRLPMRPDWEVALRPALDWLVAHDGVDPDRIAVVGRSYAGHLAARGSIGDDRIAALVLDPGQHDFLSRMVPSRFDEATWQRVLDHDAEVEAELEGLLDSDAGRTFYGPRMTTLGADTVAEFLRRQATYTLEGLDPALDVPVLLTEGEGDPVAQTEAMAAWFGDRAEVHRFPAAGGAGGHCSGLGATVWEGVVFDWLAEQVEGPDVVRRAETI
jgi:hypothetical protein